MVLTSNRSRDLHDALRRRCLYHWLEFPDAGRAVAILRRTVPRRPRAGRVRDPVRRARPHPRRRQAAGGSPRRSTGSPPSPCWGSPTGAGRRPGHPRGAGQDTGRPRRGRRPPTPTVSAEPRGGAGPLLRRSTAPLSPSGSESGCAAPGPVNVPALGAFTEALGPRPPESGPPTGPPGSRWSTTAPTSPRSTRCSRRCSGTPPARGRGGPRPAPGPRRRLLAPSPRHAAATAKGLPWHTLPRWRATTGRRPTTARARARAAAECAGGLADTPFDELDAEQLAIGAWLEQAGCAGRHARAVGRCTRRRRVVRCARRSRRPAAPAGSPWS